MAYGFLLRIVWAMGLVLLQALVFNHIHLWGYATPVVCAYVLCLQPLRQSRSLWLLWGFCTGLASDLFSQTPGVGAASMTLAAFCAPPLLRLFAPKDSADDMVASYRTLGRWKYVGYVFALLLLQQGAAVLLEMFSFADTADLLITWVASVGLTLPLLLLMERMRSGDRRKEGVS